MSILDDLKGKTVLVTGASRGIGRAIARAFGLIGCNVVINYLNSEDMAIELKRELEGSGVSAVIVRADVRDPSQVERMVNFVVEEFGSIHILVNNVGNYIRKDFLEIDLEDLKEILEVNLYTTFNAIKETLPHMIKQKWGRIINIASISGVRGSTRAPHYAAAKAAVIGLTKSLAKKYGRFNITVNAVAPGLVDTDLMRKWFSDEEIVKYEERNPMGRIAKPEEIAQIVVSIAASSYLNGEVIVVSGGEI